MTTTTLPDVDLEQLVDEDAEQGCEALPFFSDGPCGVRADWVVTMRCPCGYMRRMALCDFHAESAARGGESACRECGDTSGVAVHAERIRSPR